MGRVMALDVGTKTIGVALTDAGRAWVKPLCTLSRKGVRQDVDKLLVLVRENEVDHVVVGLPWELDGSEGRSARLARQVGTALATAASVAVDWVDERYTSVEAEARLIAQDVSRRRRKEIIDQEAAVLILEAWIAQGGRGDDPGSA